MSKPLTRPRTATEAIEESLRWADTGAYEWAQIYATLAVALATTEQTEALRPRQAGGFHRPPPTDHPPRR